MILKNTLDTPQDEDLLLTPIYQAPPNTRSKNKGDGHPEQWSQGILLKTPCLKKMQLQKLYNFLGIWNGAWKTYQMNSTSIPAKLGIYGIMLGIVTHRACIDAGEG